MSVTIEKETEHYIFGSRVRKLRVAIDAESAPVIETGLSTIDHATVSPRAATTPRDFDLAESGPVLIPSFGELVTDTLDVEVVGL